MTISYSSEYLFYDNPEVVTVTVANANTTVAYAFREEITARRAAYSGIQLTGKELLWTIPVALMGSTDIQPERATITDAANVVWHVTQVVKTYVGSSALAFECLCLQRQV